MDYGLKNKLQGDKLYETWINSLNERTAVIADRARPLFIGGGKDYVGGYLPHTLNKLNARLELPQIIKGEKTGRRKPDNISIFMNAMACVPEEVVKEIVSHCLDKKKDVKTVLDLGGGPGKYSKVFVNRGLKAVLLDTPETIDYVSSEFGLAAFRQTTPCQPGHHQTAP
jgi:hypothetical protein